jgi:hypothetical protein
MRDDLSLLKEVGRRHEPAVMLEQEARRALLAAVAGQRRRSRTRPLVFGLAFVTAVAALLAAVLARGDSPSVAARAYAAISPTAGVMHFVEEQPPAHIKGGIDREHDVTATTYQEFWIDLAHPKRLRIVTSTGGRAVAQWVQVTRHVPYGSVEWKKSGAVRTSIMQAAPRVPGAGPGGVSAGQNPLAAYRDLLKNGVVLSDDETTYDGRDAYKLVVQFKPPYDLVGDVWPGDIETYIVDRTTYFPLESTYQLDFTMGGTISPFITRFPLFEILPASPETLALLRPDPHPQPYPR